VALVAACAADPRGAARPAAPTSAASAARPLAGSDAAAGPGDAAAVTGSDAAAGPGPAAAVARPDVAAGPGAVAGSDAAADQSPVAVPAPVTPVDGGSGGTTDAAGGRGAPAASGLTRQQVLRVVMGQRATFQACFERELRRKPDLAGQIVVSWHIGADGQVGEARLESSTMHDERVEDCIVTAVRALRFPPAADGQPTHVVSFPFGFAGRPSDPPR
jgi:outer membrane biosynthesis protein TonB